MEIEQEFLKSIFFKKALTIRRTEEKLLDLFSKGELNGTVHTSIGQEFVGVAISENTSLEDVFFSNHRGHGHFLSRTDDVFGLISEVMGRKSGISKGVGGSQHLYSYNFYSNGIQGGLVPIASGVALSQKLSKTNQITVVFIGDGTLGEGVVYESFNIASKWELPLLIVIENNKIAQSTNVGTTMAGSMKKRAEAFDIKYEESNTWDIIDLREKSKNVIDYVRNEKKPALFEIETYRLGAHSKGDDSRDINEVKKYWGKDIILQILEKHKENTISLLNDIDQHINQAISNARLNEYCDYCPTLSTANDNSEIAWKELASDSTAERRYSDYIYESLRSLLSNYNKSIVIGEDIESPYGGAFKITKDLSEIYPGRVINTPISEAAIVGIGSGLSLRGWIVVVEIMFGDFMTLTFDQILNHASKFCTMYGKEIQLPLVIRTPTGGKRGYGPTHSQSLEKFFLGIPNINVYSLNKYLRPDIFYSTLFDKGKTPSLVFENKQLYPKTFNTTSKLGFKILISTDLFPSIKVIPDTDFFHVTIVCYGGILEDVEEAAFQLFIEEEILCEIICLTQLYPLDIRHIQKSVSLTKKLLIVEEGSKFVSLSGEIISELIEMNTEIEKVKRISYDNIIPSSYQRELELLPNSTKIIKTVKAMI